MNAIIRHIEYLISRTDCVIIPGLGAVLANYRPASYCIDTMMYMPPKRLYSFNSSLVDSDGMLASSISRAEGISIEDAVEKIKAEVEAMNRQLHIQGLLSLGRVGMLSFDAETGIVTFSDYGEDCLSVTTAWLQPVVKPAVEVETLPEIKQVVRVNHFWRAVKVAASIALLICISFVASTPISIDDATLASLYPEIKSASIEDMMPSDDVIAEDPMPELSILANCDYPLFEDVEEVQLDYMVIIGSFTTEAEADAYIKHKGMNAKIYEKNGRFRIYSQAFATESEAYAAISKMPQNSNAWVCKR